MLENCLPDGGCFTRQGTLATGGHNLLVIASGARSIVTHIYFRNPATPIGEAAVLASLKQTGFSADLARCPVPDTTGGTKLVSTEGHGQRTRRFVDPDFLQRKALRRFRGITRRRLAAAATESTAPVLRAMLGDGWRSQASFDRAASRATGADLRDPHSAGVGRSVL